MPVFLASFASMVLGFGDFFAGLGGRRDPHPGAVMTMATIASAVGAVIAGSYLLVFPPDVFGADDLVWSLAAMVFASLARPLLYLGMERGPMVVFAPVLGVVSLILPAAATPIVGDPLSTLELLGVALAIPAVVMIVSEGGTPSLGALRASGAFRLGVIVGVLISGISICLGQVDEGAGAMPALFSQGGAVVLIPILTRPILPLAPLSGTVVRYGMLVGVIDIGAVIASTVAFQTGNVAVVAAIMALAPAITIGLAHRFLHERVQRWQWTGAVLAVVCVALFAVA